MSRVLPRAYRKTQTRLVKPTLGAACVTCLGTRRSKQNRERSEGGPINPSPSQGGEIPGVGRLVRDARSPGGQDNRVFCVRTASISSGNGSPKRRCRPFCSSRKVCLSTVQTRRGQYCGTSLSWKFGCPWEQFKRWGWTARTFSLEEEARAYWKRRYKYR